MQIKSLATFDHVRGRKNAEGKSMYRKIQILIDILFTPLQTILVIICGSFQCFHNMKKQVKIKEKFKAFVAALELHKQNHIHVKIDVLISLLDHRSSVF